MQPPYNTPMVASLTRDDQFYVAQNGKRYMAKIAHVLAICEGSASPGAPGLSAYQVARQEGYGGTQAQWVASLQGAPGASAYQVARQNGYGGTETQWLASLKAEPGANGLSAYQIAQAAGFAGTQAQWLDSLKGAPGPDRIKVAKTLTTPATGVLAIADVPASATVLIVSPKTDGAIQKSVVRVGTTVTVSFRILQTGILPAILSSLFATSAPVTFDFVAIEPTA